MCILQLFDNLLVSCSRIQADFRKDVKKGSFEGDTLNTTNL
jgi:hypothetical protein